MNDIDRNFEDLCYACRTGDLANVDRLITTGVNLNSVDKFDNSPLFLASLCGHKDVVLLLLKSGAICDRDRYEGARCIYGALTDVIRDILLSYDISKAVDMTQPFASHISSLLLNKHDIGLNTFDMKIYCSLDNKTLQAHKFIIQARCPLLFKELVQTSCLNFEMYNISSYILEIILKFIYLVPVLHVIKLEDLLFLDQLTKRLDMSLLNSFIKKIKHIVDPPEKSTLMAEYQFKFTMDAKGQLKDFVSNCIIKNSLFLDKVETFDQEEALHYCNTFSDSYFPFFPDVLVKIKDNEENIHFYPCHLSILKRFDYFNIMFLDPFCELTVYNKKTYELLEDNHEEILPILTLNTICKEIFEMILRYLYYDDSNIDLTDCIGVIKMADFLLDDRLKSVAATLITQNDDILNILDVFEILYFAWGTRIERLEHYAAKHVAMNLDKYIDTSAFKKAILKSAERISNREESDSIEFVDDIRFYLLEKYKLEPEDIEYYEELSEIEDDLETDFASYKNDCLLINGILFELNLNMFKINN